MRFMIVMKCGGALPDTSSFDEQLVRAGVLLAADTLRPAGGGDLSRFWIIQARSEEEAQQWVRQLPAGDPEAEIEVRNVVEGEERAVR